MIENGQHKVTAVGSTAPGTCEVVWVEMENHLGDVKRIENLVSSFKILESLYSPALGLEMSLRDESNFFEEFQITGQEIVRVKLRQKLFQGERNSKLSIVTELEFFVTEYLDYLKGNKNQVQSYTLTGISKHAYISPLKRISRAMISSVDEEIRRLLEKDLLVEKFIIQGKPASAFSGVINWTNPLPQAVDFSNRIYDANQSPFFLFQKLNGTVYLSALSFFVNEQDNPVYRTYRDQMSTFADTLDTAAAELDAYTRILAFNSELELSKMTSANDGAYSSLYTYYDLSTKTHETKFYDYVRDFKKENTLEKRLNINEDYVVPPLNLEWNKIQRANQNFRMMNRFSRGGVRNIQENIKSNSHFRKFYLKNFETCEHVIELNGDLLLNPGRVIQLEIMKSTDPTIYKEYTGKNYGKGLDEMFSGKYLVTTCEHRFENKGSSYKISCTVNKDSWKVPEIR